MYTESACTPTVHTQVACVCGFTPSHLLSIKWLFKSALYDPYDLFIMSHSDLTLQVSQQVFSQTDQPYQEMHCSLCSWQPC